MYLYCASRKPDTAEDQKCKSTSRTFRKHCEATKPVSRSASRGQHARGNLSRKFTRLLREEGEAAAHTDVHRITVAVPRVQTRQPSHRIRLQWQTTCDFGESTMSGDVWMSVRLGVPPSREMPSPCRLLPSRIYPDAPENTFFGTT